MICKVCLNEWESGPDETRCPFCGADLSMGADQHDVAGVIAFLIKKEGIDVLLRPDNVTAFISDLVRGHDRDKKLMRVGISNGVLQRAHAILVEPKQSRREIMVLDMKQHLMEGAFLSEQNAETIVAMTMSGIGLPSLSGVVSRSQGAEVNKKEEKKTVTRSGPEEPNRSATQRQAAEEKKEKAGAIISPGKFTIQSMAIFAYDGTSFDARKVMGPVFLKEETGTIGIKLSFEPLSAPMNVSMEWQIFHEDGTPVVGSIHGSGFLTPGSIDFCQGGGWKKPGRWKAGRYIIRATMNGSDVVTGYFNVIEGRFDDPVLTMYGARLFTAGSTPPPPKERKYAEVFSASEVRKIYFEISMSTIITPSRTTMNYLITGPDGEVIANFAEPVSMRVGGDRCWTGFGWDKPGRWRKGRYYYEVSIGRSNNLFQGVFDIV